MKKAVISLFAILMAVPMMAQTVPSRIAVINVQKVLADSTAGKAAFQKLKTLQEERAAKLKKLNDDLAQMQADISQKQMSLSEDKLADLQKTYNEKKIAAQRYAQDAERELTDARDQSLQQLENQIMPVITTIGKEMGFAIILNKFESGLVYASDAIDITDIVVKRFNEKAPAAPAPAKPGAK